MKSITESHRIVGRLTSNNRSGFSLIELLVVLSIISLLIAILLPALGKAREVAQQTVCGSNTRQITVAQNFYAVDYDGFFAPTESYTRSHMVWGRWTSAGVFKFTGGTPGDDPGPTQKEYLVDRELLLCPSRDETVEIAKPWWPSENRWGSTYFLVASTGNSFANSSYHRYGFYGHMLRDESIESNPELRGFCPNIDFTGRVFSSADPHVGSDFSNGIYVAEPSEQPAAAEPNEPNDTPTNPERNGFYEVLPPTAHPSMSHEDGGNISFLDGHTEFRARDEVVRRIRTFNSENNIYY